MSHFIAATWPNGGDVRYASVEESSTVHNAILQTVNLLEKPPWHVPGRRAAWDTLFNGAVSHIAETCRHVFASGRGRSDFKTPSKLRPTIASQYAPRFLLQPSALKPRHGMLAARLRHLTNCSSLPQSRQLQPSRFQISKNLIPFTDGRSKPRSWFASGVTSKPQDLSKLLHARAAPSFQCQYGDAPKARKDARHQQPNFALANHLSFFL